MASRTLLRELVRAAMKMPAEEGPSLLAGTDGGIFIRDGQDQRDGVAHSGFLERIRIGCVTMHGTRGGGLQ